MVESKCFLTTLVLAAVEQLPETIPGVEPDGAGMHDPTTLASDGRANNLRAIAGREELPPA